MAAYRYLMKNGYKFILSNDNLYNTSIKVAAGERSDRSFARRLKNNLYLIEE